MGGAVMKHLKILNRQKRVVGHVRPGEEAAVKAMQLLGCSTVFDPGWEVDFLGAFSGLCHPIQNDLYGCALPCWWPAQVPDDLTNYVGFSDLCAAAIKDWQDIKLVE